MLNGDSITGATDVKLMTVETEWGVAQINGQSIQSILFVPRAHLELRQGAKRNPLESLRVVQLTGISEFYPWGVIQQHA